MNYEMAVSTALTFNPLKKRSISTSSTSNGRFPINAVKGGSLGTLDRSTLGPRAARGAVGKETLTELNSMSSTATTENENDCLTNFIIYNRSRK